jgi:hypothetical protein
MNYKDTYTKVFLEAANQEVTPENISKHKPIWWYNYREKASGGLRLTDEGFEFVTTQSNLKTYTVEVPKEIKFTPQVLLWLDQGLLSPFYLKNRLITVISERAAFELYLFSGDIRKMGTAKALNKRLNQD